jgi:hypothetical protein
LPAGTYTVLIYYPNAAPVTSSMQVVYN